MAWNAIFRFLEHHLLYFYLEQKYNPVQRWLKRQKATMTKTSRLKVTHSTIIMKGMISHVYNMSYVKNISSLWKKINEKYLHLIIWNNAIRIKTLFKSYFWFFIIGLRNLTGNSSNLYYQKRVVVQPNKLGNIFQDLGWKSIIMLWVI